MTLEVRLDAPLPGELAVGSGTALFVCGTCFAPDARIRSLALVVDGEEQPLMAHGMPRLDVLHALVAPTSYRSGFWGMATVGPRPPGAVCQLALRARLDGGGDALAEVARIPVAAPPAPAEGAPLVAICMATHEPPPDLFRRQVESIRAQTERDWVCVVSDDCSAPERFAALQDVLAGDPRFLVSRSERRLGFYGNFERALRLAPAEAELVALCDQDDRWHPDKLATLRAALGGAAMAYSDQRLVDARGRVLRETLWEGRRNNHTDIASLLVANSITGAATLFRRDVADLALPFPDSPGLQFHDHWLGLVALAAGDIAYVDRPLYDYVQHEKAVFGDVTQTRRSARRRFLRGGRGAYFLGYAGRAVQARTLLVRTEPAPEKRRALERYLAAERSPAAFAWLALHGLTHRRETLGSELELLRGIAWRHARPPDVTIPDPLAFEQRRLRRWRARI